MEADLLEPAHILPLLALASFVRRCFVSVVPVASLLYHLGRSLRAASPTCDATVRLPAIGRSSGVMPQG